MKSGPIRHVVNVIHGQLREAAKRGNVIAQIVTGEPPRSSKWRHIEKHFLLGHPGCVACGGSKRLNVHHVKPFHTFPELELANGEPAPPECNLITLCMGPDECHLKIGHGDDFKAYNPTVRDDAQLVRRNPSSRADVESRAKVSRLYARSPVASKPTL